MILEGRHHTGSLEAEFDYVIVGSGAAGATVARVLADTGQSIAVVEEGPAVKTSDFGDKVWPGLHKMMRNAGAQLARGKAFIPIIQGSCLGGSTVVNSAIMWRIPDDVFQVWDASFGLADALPRDALHRHWDQIESELHIRPVTDEALGHNTRMERGAEALGVSGQRTRRGETGCRGSARCLTGCPHGAKQSMLVSYLPYAHTRGAVSVTDAKVRRIIIRRGRAVAVVGKLKKSGHSFRIGAKKAVIVAASTIHTPGLLHRSGVRNYHLGRHFQGHPGNPLIGVFDEEVNPWVGATQGFDAHEHRRSRFKIETLSLPPEMAFVRMPGVGRRWLENIARSNYTLSWALQLRSWSEGRVRPLPFGVGPDIQLSPNTRDMHNLRRGLKFMARLFFAGGAKEVILPIHGMPERIAPHQVDLLDEAPMNPAAYTWIMSHLFGTTRMALTDKDGVVDTEFRVFGTKNLYVADSSVFPTNLGVNPQQAIQGVAMHCATKVAALYA